MCQYPLFIMKSKVVKTLLKQITLATELSNEGDFI